MIKVKIDVDATDIIMSNLCYMQKMENVIGFADTSGDINEADTSEEGDEDANLR